MFYRSYKHALFAYFERNRAQYNCPKNPKNLFNFAPVAGCAAHIGMGGVKIEKEPRQWDEYVYRIS